MSGLPKYSSPVVGGSVAAILGRNMLVNNSGVLGQSLQAEQETAIVQRFVWQQAMRGWKPFDGRWSQEDSDFVRTHYGFMLLQHSGGDYYLVTTSQAQSHDATMSTIATLAPICPFCAKAAGILAGQKLRGGLDANAERAVNPL